MTTTATVEFAGSVEPSPVRSRVEGGRVAKDAGRDFFISYTRVNAAWARWIALELERAGYTTVLQDFDFRPGSDFLDQMQRATSTAARTIAVLSPAYFASEFSRAEWRVAFAKDPSGDKGLLVPVRVQPCDPEGLLLGRLYVDFVDADELTCRRELQAAVDRNPQRPTMEAFPGTVSTSQSPKVARFPGSGAAISNLPRRNRNFTGRDELLNRLHSDLLAGSAAAVVVPTEAIHGLGGIGKTQLVTEYAHRFASDYDITWWLPAEEPTAAVAALAGLARRLGIPETSDRSEMVAALFELLRNRDRWLLVYDNAEHPDQLTGLLPDAGPGHVLVTSRWHAWGRQATPLRLGVLSREESVAFLRGSTDSQDQTGVAALAELLGDLPLALDEAAAYLEETGVGVQGYLELVRTRSRELFGLDTSSLDEHADRRRVGTVWSVSLDRVRQHTPAAEALLNLCACLAPQIPRDLPTEHPDALPMDLAAAVTDVLAYNGTLAVIGRYSLATVTPSTMEVHRLVQTVIQARLGTEGERAWAATAVTLLRSRFPDDSWEVTSWPLCERLLPHVLAATGHAERLGVAGEAAGWLLDRASTYLRERGQYKQAKPLAERAIRLTESALGSGHVQVAWRHDALGRVLQGLGDLPGARTQLERALQIAEAAQGPNHPTVGNLRGNLGSLLRGLGDRAAARAQLEQALQITEAALGPDHPDVGNLRGNLGSVLRGLGDLPAARTQLEQALQITEAALGPNHPTVGTWRNNLGRVLRNLGDLPAARTQLEQALQITEAALGPDHPTVGIRRGNLGSVLQDLGDLPGAHTEFERALQISEAALGPNHPDVAIGWGNLGGVLQDLGDLPAARTHLERALQITEAALGPNHPDAGTWRNNLGTVLQDLGDLPAARTQLEQALQITEAALGPNHPTVGTWRNNLGSVLQDLGDLPGARTEFERALQITEAALGPDHPAVGIRRASLGSVLLDLGDLPAARTQLERALQITEAVLGPDHPTVRPLRNTLQGLGYG